MDQPQDTDQHEWAPMDRHQAQLRALRAMAAVLDQFPVEEQVAMVKALTARTLVKVTEQHGVTLEHTPR